MIVDHAYLRGPLGADRDRCTFDLVLQPAPASGERVDRPWARDGRRVCAALRREHRWSEPDAWRTLTDDPRSAFLDTRRRYTRR